MRWHSRHTLQKTRENFIRKLLRETEETRVTLDMLNDCGFMRVKTVPGFQRRLGARRTELRSPDTELRRLHQNGSPPVFVKVCPLPVWCK